MGEWVWTSYKIGGKIETTEQFDRLCEIAEGFEDGDSRESMIAAARKGDSIFLAGECNYGNNDELDALLIAAGLTFHANWAAQPGQFHSGCRFWNPDMVKVGECACDDEGDPTACLAEIRRAVEGGRSIEAVLADLELASADRVPAFAMSDELLAAEPA